MNDREARVSVAAYCALLATVDVGPATVTTTPEAPGSPMLNRIVGLGVDRPATEEDVDAALAAVPSGTTFYVAVEPDARPDALPSWLAARGLEPGWGWMRFRRGVESPAAASSALRIEPVDSGDLLGAFAFIVRAGYGLPEGAEAAVMRAAGTGWRLWVALDGEEPAGAGGLYVENGVGYLGLAATLTEHRGKGAQTALLHHRIRESAALGCDVVVTETGERRNGLPSDSYRNLVRAGFAEVAVTANWLGRRP